MTYAVRWTEWVRCLNLRADHRPAYFEVDSSPHDPASLDRVFRADAVQIDSKVLW